MRVMRSVGVRASTRCRCRVHDVHQMVDENVKWEEENIPEEGEKRHDTDSNSHGTESTLMRQASRTQFYVAVRSAMRRLGRGEQR